MQKRIRALGEEITATRGRQDAVLGELNKLEQRIASTQAELRRLDEAHKAQQLKVDATRRQREQAVAALKAQQALLGQQMRAAFVMGDGAQTRMLMQQDDAQRVSRLMTYFERLNQARGAQIAAIDAQTRALRDLWSSSAPSSSRCWASLRQPARTAARSLPSLRPESATAAPH